MVNTQEQLEFPGIKLGELVRELLALRQAKADANVEFNANIKLLEKEIKEIAYEMGDVKQ